MRTRRMFVRLSVLTLSSVLVMSLAAPAQAVTRDEKDVAWRINHEPVSYTHLTLPTKA